MAETQEKLNLEEKVNVRNLAGWTVGFARLAEMHGDVSIPPEGTARLSRNEIIMQTQNGNRLFTGTDTRGSHATLYIEDKATRVEVDFESEDGKVKQDILTDEKVKYLFSLKTDKSFEENLKKSVITRAEKYAIVKIIKRLKIDNYSKMKIVENFTGYKFD